MKVSIVGITGYSGLELVKILNNHKKVELVSIHATKEVGRRLSDVYPYLTDVCDLDIEAYDAEKIMKKADLVFFATPSGVASSLAEEFVQADFPVIDLSGDHRLPADVYQEWYKKSPAKQSILNKFTYVLSEYTDVKDKKFIANPGCYTTCSILTAYPLAKEGLIDMDTLIIDAKSGTSGAGRGAKVPNLYCEVNENIKAYGVATHRHTPEIEDQLGYACGQEVLINFTPHLIPMNRGILVTAYASLKKEVSYEEVRAAYDKYYADETFIRVLDKDVCPQTKCVEGSNYVDVNFKIDPRTKRVIMMGAMDNLVKGAAGQAVQNMNLLFGLPETEGLLMPPVFP